MKRMEQVRLTQILGQYIQSLLLIILTVVGLPEGTWAAKIFDSTGRVVFREMLETDLS